MEDSTKVGRATGLVSVDPAEERRLYALFHAPRFGLLVDLLREHGTGYTRIADFGPSPLTETIRTELGVPVDTFGLEPPQHGPEGDHHHVDLNALRDGPVPPPEGADRYDVVVFAEVLEHLYVSPRLVLEHLAPYLVDGGLVVVQTPNAVTLVNRIKMLLGRQPFELINEDPGNPGHVREYTAGELRAYAEAAGYDVVDLRLCGYFDHRYAHHSAGVPERRFTPHLRNAVDRFLTRSLRPGLTVVLRRAPSSSGPDRPR